MLLITVQNTYDFNIKMRLEIVLFFCSLRQIITSDFDTDGCKSILAHESSARATKFYFLTYDARCNPTLFSGGWGCRTDCTHLDYLSEHHSSQKTTSVYSPVILSPFCSPCCSAGETIQKGRFSASSWCHEPPADLRLPLYTRSKPAKA